MAQPDYTEQTFDSLVTVEGTAPSETPDVTASSADEQELPSPVPPEDVPTEAAPPPSGGEPARDEQGRFVAKTDEPAQPAVPAPPKRKESPQDRINKAIARQRDAERERDYFRALAEQQAQLKASAPPAATPAAARPAPDDDPEPRWEDYQNNPKLDDPYLALVRDTGRWEARQVLREASQQAEQAHYQHAFQSRVQQHQQQLQQLRAQVPDYDSLMEVANSTPVSADLAQAILASDVSAPLVLHLARHSDAMDELGSLQGAALYRRLGQLEASLHGANGSSRQASRPPAITPIQPVGSSPVQTTPAPDDLEFGPEYIRQMNMRDAERKKFRY